MVTEYKVPSYCIVTIGKFHVIHASFLWKPQVKQLLSMTSFWKVFFKHAKHKTNSLSWCNFHMTHVPLSLTYEKYAYVWGEFLGIWQPWQDHIKQQLSGKTQQEFIQIYEITNSISTWYYVLHSILKKNRRSRGSLIEICKHLSKGRFSL